MSPRSALHGSIFITAFIVNALAACSSETGGGGTSSTTASGSSTTGASSSASGTGGGSTSSASSSASVGGGGAGGASASSSAGTGGMGGASSSSASSSSGAGGGALGGGDPLWIDVFPLSNPFGNQQIFVFPTAAVDPAGNALVAGGFSGVADFGAGGMFPSGPNGDGYLLKLDSAGNHVAHAHFGSGFDSVNQTFLAIDPAANIAVASSAESNSAFTHSALARFGAPWTGQAPLWSKTMGGISSDVIPFHMTTDAAGDLYMHLHSQLGFDFGGGLVSGNLLVKRSSSGQFLWNKPADGSIATDGPGNVFVFGLSLLTKLDPSGNTVWTKSFGAAGGLSTLAVDAAGNVLFVVSFNGTIDFGGGPLTSTGTMDLAVAKLDNAGNHLWSKRLGSAGTSINTLSLAVDGNGDLIVAGGVTGAIDLGGGALTSGGFLAKVGGSGGALKWSRETSAAYLSVAGDSTGYPIIASADIKINLGTGALLAPYATPLGSSTALLVAKLAP